MARSADARRSRRAEPESRLWLFFAWLAAFYAVWVTLVVAADRWVELESNWPIAVAMVFGSYVAGSTPLGGGTVGFPALVLLLQEPASLGRDFSFAIQSVGMTSASILILCRRQRLEWKLLRWAMIGTVLGLPLGLFFVAPNVSEVATKVLFAVALASFGAFHLGRADEICANASRVRAGHAPVSERHLGFGVGLLSAMTVAPITGAGADMVLYATLVLVMRTDLRTAIASSVVLMAFTSVLAVAIKSLVTGLQPGVFEQWLPAAPVVACGAPLGAFAASIIDRRLTLRLVSVLCVLQFVATLGQEFRTLGVAGVSLAVAAVAVLNGVFAGMRRLGRRAARDRRSLALAARRRGRV